MAKLLRFSIALLWVHIVFCIPIKEQNQNVEKNLFSDENFIRDLSLDEEKNKKLVVNLNDGRLFPDEVLKKLEEEKYKQKSIERITNFNGGKKWQKSFFMAPYKSYETQYFGIIFEDNERSSESLEPNNDLSIENVSRQKRSKNSSESHSDEASKMSSEEKKRENKKQELLKNVNESNDVVLKTSSDQKLLKSWLNIDQNRRKRAENSSNDSSSNSSEEKKKM